MSRLMSTTPCPVATTVADIDTVRASARSFDAWLEKFAFAGTCPACRRKGVPNAELSGHLEHCPLHPAVARARASAAVLQLRLGTAVPALLLGEFDPVDFRDRSHGYLRKKREEALAELFEFDASELAKSHEEELLDFVEDWEELQRVATPRPCPWCAADSCRAEHLLNCPMHPAIAEHPGPTTKLERLAARLQFEADQCAVRLARLCESCVWFFNSMGEGEGGKSISNPEIEAEWYEARKEAASTLATVPERLASH